MFFLGWQKLPEITPSEPDLDNSSVGKRVKVELPDAGQAVSPGGNGFFFWISTNIGEKLDSSSFKKKDN